MANYFYIFGKKAIKEYLRAELTQDTDIEKLKANGRLYNYDDKINHPENILDMAKEYDCDYLRISEENYRILENLKNSIEV